MPALPVRAARRARHRPRLRQGHTPCAPPHLPRGPVPVVRRHRPPAGRGPAGQPRPPPGRRHSALPRRRRAARPATQHDRPATRIQVCRAAHPDRVHVSRPRRTTPAPRSTSTPRSWSSTTSGPRRQRQPQPPVLDARQRTVLRRPRLAARPASPADPAASATVPGVFARDLRLTLMREHLDRVPGRPRRRRPADPADAVRSLGDAADTLDAWYTGGRHGRRPPGRLRRHDPPPLSAFTRSWATVPYHFFYDPDGRPRTLRRTDSW